jgi:hypothetical protein
MTTPKPSLKSQRKGRIDLILNNTNNRCIRKILEAIHWNFEWKKVQPNLMKKRNDILNIIDIMT